jgi:hypothetical protein
MAASFSPAPPAPGNLGDADPVERWGQLTLEGNLALERGEDFKARQSYSEALAVAEGLMVAAARAHDARAALFAPALYGISCNDIIALARRQGDGLTAGIFLCKLAGGYLSVMESSEAPIALRARCLLHSRVASATLCAYFDERGMWDATETYSARANSAFFSVQALQHQSAAAPSLPPEPSLLLLEPTVLLFDPSLLPGETSLLLPEPNLPPAPSLPPEPRLLLPEASLPPEPRLPPELRPRSEPRPPPLPSAPPPRIPRPTRPVASVIPVEPATASFEPAASLEPAAASFELPNASSLEPAPPSTRLPLPAVELALRALDLPLSAPAAPAPPSAHRGLAAFGDAHIVPPLAPWEPPPELRASLWSDAHPALDLSPPEPPPRRTWGARLIDWAARAFRRSPRSSLPSFGSRSA